MSPTKLLKASIKLFKKDAITFLVIRRYDLGILEDKLRYIGVKPYSSISSLRQKVWHLLDLPDFCDEIIILKSDNDVVIPLTELRKGNDPQHPYILEVWLPEPQYRSSTTLNNLLTIENGEDRGQSDLMGTNHDCGDDKYLCPASQTTISNETMPLNNLRDQDKSTAHHVLSSFKKSDLSYRISASSLFRLNRKKSQDNFTSILLKMQSDLSTLSSKLSSLENRIPTRLISPSNC